MNETKGRFIIDSNEGGDFYLIPEELYGAFCDAVEKMEEEPEGVIYIGGYSSGVLLDINGYRIL